MSDWETTLEWDRYGSQAETTRTRDRGDCLEHPFASMITAFGVTALTFMMLMYAVERRGPGFVLAFAAGCALSSVYGFLSGAWPFGVVEAIWCVIALRRFREAMKLYRTGQI